MRKLKKFCGSHCLGLSQQIARSCLMIEQNIERL